VVEELALQHGATVAVTTGPALAEHYPLVHAVGQAASQDRLPRLIELEWGNPSHPRVALVGKGVCFDTGGLDIKSATGMLLMKKDMGGAAHALALARLVMGAGLAMRLHVLIPAVENALSSRSLRPGDIIRSRKGLSVEIGNTDAEGRLILADAVTRAGEGRPDLIIDFATLTSAARVALGPDLPALLSNDDLLAQDCLAAGAEIQDPVWRMPLWQPYNDMLASEVADVGNAGSRTFGGAIAAALFIERFIPAGLPWLHLDTYAWRPVGKPGRPKGGDALGLRAAWRLLQRRYGRQDST
jgi:leucyl aminopeptidase